MKYSNSIHEDLGVLAIEGEFQFHGAMEIRRAAEELVGNPAVKRIEVDLGGAQYLDSSALGTLLTVRDLARKAGKTVTLTNCRGEVRNTLDVARFSNLFTIT